MTISVNPRRALVFLLILTAVLLLAHIASQFFLFNLGFRTHRNFWAIKLFDFGRETNIPTLYSTLLLLVSSLLCALIYRSRKQAAVPGAYYWAILSVIFLFIGIDENAMIHEAMIKPLRAALNASSVFYFAWVIPYGILLVVIVLTFYKFVMSLPSRIKKVVLLAAGVYITGVLVFEMVGGHYADINSTKTIFYATLVIFEETLEMIGLNIFIYALLSYVSVCDQDIHVSIET